MARESTEGILTPDQKWWLDRLSLNEENLSAVLSLYLETDRVGEAAEMAVSLLFYWESKGRFSAGIEWYQRILKAGTGEVPLKNDVLTALGAMYLGSGDYSRALAVLEKAAAAESLLSLYYLAWACFRSNSLERADDLFNRSIALSETAGREILRAKSLAGKGLVYWKKGDLEKAEDSLKDALDLLYTGGDPRSIAQTMNNLGLILHCKKDYPAAERYFAEAYSKFKRIGDIAEVRKLLNNLGDLNFKMEKLSAAAKYYRELQRLSAHDDLFLGMSYYGLALTGIAGNKPDRALRNAEKAVAILNKPVSQLDYGIALRVLGDVRRFRKEYSLTRECYSKAIPILEKYGEEEDLELARRGMAALDGNK